jgi:hypothetical protein
MSRSILLRAVLCLPPALKAGQLRQPPLSKPFECGSIKSGQGKAYGRRQKRKCQTKAIDPSTSNTIIVKTLKKAKNNRSIYFHAFINTPD